MPVKTLHSTHASMQFYDFRSVSTANNAVNDKIDFTVLIFQTAFEFVFEINIMPINFTWTVTEPFCYVPTFDTEMNKLHDK